MVAYGNLIKKLGTSTPTPAKSLILEQEPSAISEAAPVLNSSKAKFPIYARKKHTTRKWGATRCLITDKICRSEKSAKRKAQKGSNQVVKLRAYACPFCSRWHLTHKRNKLTMH